MPSRQLVSSGSPFETAYGYSRAVCDGDLTFISGTTGYDFKAMTMLEDVAEQARNIFRTFADVLVSRLSIAVQELMLRRLCRVRRGPV